MSSAYNGLGERVRKVTSAGTVYFAYDESGHLIGEYNGTGGLIQETVWLGDLPLATLRPDGQSGVDIYYVHADHLNSPRRITDDTATVIWRWGSDPYGSTPANEDPDGDTNLFAYNLRFPGQYLDEETGLNYNYFRDYEPVTGRYVESDPIGLGAGLNTYAYAEQQPLNNADPTGLVVWNGWETVFGGSFIVGAAVAFYELESDRCYDQRKAKVTLAGYGQASGFGLFAAGGSLSTVSIDDGKSYLDPYGLQGFYGRYSAAASGMGVGYGASRVAMGGRHLSVQPATANGGGRDAFLGVDFGITSIWGSATVIKVEWEDCPCSE